MTRENSSTSLGDFKLRFWGTRGTLATPDAECKKAGGNTVCVEINCGDQTIICDAGTGIRLLGSKIIADNAPHKLNLFLSHAHYDHVEGIPFFAPLFSRDYDVDIWCGKLDGANSTKQTVEEFMRRPYFPVGPEVFCANLNYHEIDERQSFDVSDDIHVRTMPLNHPGGATAYRIEYGNKVVAYVTDTEHNPGETNIQIAEFITDADVFIYDSSLTDEELPEFSGYGHSTWQEGLRLAKHANVRHFFAFHHMPFRCDRDLDKIDAEINDAMPGSGIAREGVSLTI